MPRMLLPVSALNPVYLPHLDDPHRYQLYFGGAGSGKSVFLATRCVLDALQGRNVLVVRRVARTLKTSCFNEITKAVSRLRLSGYFKVNRSEMTLTAASGAQILFAGLDDVEKIKSITPACGVLTDIWMEEATECTRQDFKQLDKRLRGLTRFPKRFTFSFNPVSKGHWLYKEFFSLWQDGKQECASDTTLLLKTTYRDNRFLMPDDIRALEDERDSYFYQVYTLGNWGETGHIIFRNWRVEDVPESTPGETRLGLDFGFASDPCAFVRLRYDRALRRVYVLEEMEERGLTNLDLARRLPSVCRRFPVACDSAEPKSVSELRRLGINAYPVRKGPDSVLHGLQWLRQMELILSPACPRLRHELESYVWQTDREGSALPIPCGRDDHLIDAMRYALAEDMTERFAHTYR